MTTSSHPDKAFSGIDGAELATAVARQLEKDFAFFQLDLPLEESEPTYSYLLDLLTQVVADLMNRDIAKLFSLLYRIDIDEKTIRNSTDGHAIASASTIAEVIIKRELQKVVLRKHYENQQ